MGIKETSSEPVLDLESALARLGGDRELFAEMAGYLLEDVPPLFDELRSAVAAGDAANVRAKAHALKGLVAGCGGTRAMKVAQDLEDAGHSCDLNRARSSFESLKTELDLLTEALADHH
jgi:HPt (histidine-containing phosphotransfer) domain-containing protein